MVGSVPETKLIVSSAVVTSTNSLPLFAVALDISKPFSETILKVAPASSLPAISCLLIVTLTGFSSTTFWKLIV